MINRAAVEKRAETALALDCEIPRQTKFDRKNYMYPDLPKGYQISQHDLPMSRARALDVDGRRVRIRRVHLEEDTGKLIHAGGTSGASPAESYGRPQPRRRAVDGDRQRA